MSDHPYLYNSDQCTAEGNESTIHHFHDWFKHLFEHFGWQILNLHYKHLEPLMAYTYSVRHFIKSLECKLRFLKKQNASASTIDDFKILHKKILLLKNNSQFLEMDAKVKTARGYIDNDDNSLISKYGRNQHNSKFVGSKPKLVEPTELQVIAPEQQATELTVGSTEQAGGKKRKSKKASKKLTGGKRRSKKASKKGSKKASKKASKKLTGGKRRTKKASKKTSKKASKKASKRVTGLIDISSLVGGKKRKSKKASKKASKKRSKKGSKK
jgi:hypothetical protein